METYMVGSLLRDFEVNLYCNEIMRNITFNVGSYINNGTRLLSLELIL